MTDREAMERALNALKQAKDAVADWGAYASEYFQHKHNLQGSIDDIQAQITVLSERLAQPVQEPMAWIHKQGNHWEVSERPLLDDEKARGWAEEPLYTAPPRREWVGLTEEEIMEPWPFENRVAFARWLEAKLKEKNT